MFWRPPTSPLCSSDTAETVTAPSCDASAPMPRPARSIGQVMISGPAPASSAATNTTRPRNRREEPELGDPPRRRLREHLRDPDRGDHQGDRQRAGCRTPVSIAESPSAIERNSGTAKNRPAWSRYWKKNAVSPLRSSRTRRIAGSSSAGLAGVAAVLLPGEEPEQHHAAAEDQPDHRRQAEPRRRVRLGLHEPPGARAQDPVDDQARARAPRGRCRRGRAGRLPPSGCRPCAG